MKKLIIVILAIGLIAGAMTAPADAKKKRKPKQRVVEATYQAPSVGVLGLGVCSPGTIGCIGFPSASNEKSVMVEVTDNLPMPYASVTQDLNGDNQADTSVGICGASTEPIPIEPGFEVTVFIWQGPGPSPVCPGGATSGTIKVTFSS